MNSTLSSTPKLKRISAELEVEHSKFSRNELEKYRKELKKKFPNFRIVFDFSLYNGGIELSNALSPISKWKPILQDLKEKGFVVNDRTGFHIHFDVTNIIKKFEDLKNLIRGILDVQLHRPNYFNKHVAPAHQVFPIVLLKSLLNTKSLDEFISTYLYELRGGYSVTNVQEALEKKYSEHDYWVDITPIMRYLIKYKHPKEGYKRVIGSIEIRGKASDEVLKDEPVDYDKFVHNANELVDLFKRVTKYI